MLATGNSLIDADTAFTRVRRSRTRAAITRKLRRRPAECGRLPVYDLRQVRSRRIDLPGTIREIPLAAISGTLEPSRARLFDADFRPSGATRRRWERIWLAEHRGEVLPPISVVPVGDGYAVRDGHHRVSVARARGALTIDATVDGLPAAA
jgi:hypothetical protein